MDYYYKELNNNNISERQANSIEYIPMGDDTIRLYYPNAKILLVSELDKYNSIDSLLPNNPDCVFLLYQSSPNNGHWVLLSKYNNTIEYFDSYGGVIDKPLSWTPIGIRTKLGEGKPLLSNLLENTKYDLIYNAVDFQDKKDNKISTCGRWASLRWNTIVNCRMPLVEFIDGIRKIKKETGRTYDNLVSDLVNHI
jgi:hypothetical protein